MTRAFLSMLILALAVPAAAQPVAATRPEPFEPDARRDLAGLSAEAWREDLAFLADRIRSVHPNPFRFSSPGAFDAEVARLDAAIPDATPAEILAGLLRVIAHVHDGHTRIQLGFPGLGGGAADGFGLRRLPVRLYAFEDGLTVVATTPDRRDLGGARVTAIGGRPTAEALEIARAYVPADDETAALDRIPRLLEIPEIVAAMGLADGPDAVALTVERDGRARTVTLPAVPTPAEWVDPREGPTPLHERRPDANYRAEWRPDGTLYVQYAAVQDQGEESIAAFFGRIYGEAAARGTERMILDMRFNGGGNNALNWPIVYGLIRSDVLNRRGRLFVLIGRRTFSAAQNGVNELERHTEAVFVGEPTGATPNHYGDAVRFETPNAGIPFFVSALYWQNHPRDDRPWTPPDVFAPPTRAAWRAGRDPALEAIEGWDPRPIFDRLVDRLEADGPDAAFRTWSAFRADPRNRFVDVEADLNRFGYTLLREERTDEAVRVFRLVVESYPESANALDSLGEALWAAGETEAAIEAYERAIEMDPDGFVGRHARSMLEEIRGD